MLCLVRSSYCKVRAGLSNTIQDWGLELYRGMVVGFKCQSMPFDPPWSSVLCREYQLVSATRVCQWLATATALTAQFCMLQFSFQILETGKSFRYRWKHLSTCCILQWSQGPLPLHYYSLFDGRCVLQFPKLFLLLQPSCAAQTVHLPFLHP